MRAHHEAIFAHLGPPATQGGRQNFGPSHTIAEGTVTKHEYQLAKLMAVPDAEAILKRRREGLRAAAKARASEASSAS